MVRGFAENQVRKSGFDIISGYDILFYGQAH
jgi:hypothetical protein